MLRRWRSGTPALGLELCLLTVGFLAGMASERMRFNQAHSQTAKSEGALVQRWISYSGAADRERLADPEADSRPWVPPLHRVDDALKKQDVGEAERAWHEAYSAVLGHRRWDGMIAVGEAYLRIGDVARGRRIAEAKARRLYLGALLLAREQRSIDGVIRAAEAFAELGDRELVSQALRVAEQLAIQAPDPQERARVRAAAERLGSRPLHAVGIDPF